LLAQVREEEEEEEEGPRGLSIELGHEIYGSLTFFLLLSLFPSFFFQLIMKISTLDDDSCMSLSLS